MDCKEIEFLLSAYADDELEPGERETIENHLSTCPDCRRNLEEYREIRSHISVMQNTGMTSDISTLVMEKIEAGKRLKSSHSWFRPVWITGPVFLIALIFLGLYFGGIFSGQGSILVKAAEKTGEIESYKMIQDIYTKSDLTDGEIVRKLHHEAEIAGPEEFRLSWISRFIHKEESIYEYMVRIGEDIYYKGQTIKSITPEQLADVTPDKYSTVEQTKYLINAEILDDEWVDNVLCYHYRGTLDVDSMWADLMPVYKEKYEKMFKPMIDMLEQQLKEKYGDEKPQYDDLEETVQGALKRTRDNLYADTSILEFWIGKDDYLIRKITMISTPIYNMWNEEKVQTILYYDFNADITIESPVTDTGKLEKDWVELEISP